MFPSEVTEAKPQLDKWEQLFIRQCKDMRTRNMRRFRRIFGMRCLLNTDHVDDYAVARFVMSIVTKLEIVDTDDFVSELMTRKIYNPLKIDDPIVSKVMALAVSYLTFWTPDERYIVPKKFKKGVDTD